MAEAALKKRGRIYRCGECTFKGDKGQYELHFTQKHASPEEVPFFCHQCTQRYGVLSSLVAHFRYAHKGVDPPSTWKGTGANVDLNMAEYTVLSRKESLKYYEVNCRGKYNSRTPTIPKPAKRKSEVSVATAGPPAKRISTPSETSVAVKPAPSKERNKDVPAGDCRKVIIKPPSIQKVAGRLNADDGGEVTPRLEAGSLKAARRSDADDGVEVALCLEAGSQKVAQRLNADDGGEVTPRLEAGSQKVTRRPNADDGIVVTLRPEAEDQKATQPAQSAVLDEDENPFVFQKVDNCGDLATFLGIGEEVLDYQELEADLDLSTSQVSTAVSTPVPNSFSQTEMETLISRSIRETVEAVSGAFATTIKANSRSSADKDSNPVFGQLLETSANMGQLACHMQSFVDCQSAHNLSMQRVVDNLAGQVTSLTQAVESCTKVIGGLVPQLTSQFAVLRAMNRASADSNIQLMETMSSQSEAFQAHGRRISGLIEDERCQGRVPSLVTRILNLPPSADDKGNAVRQPPTSLPLPPPADRQGSFTKPLIGLPKIGLPKITVDGPRKPLSELRDNKKQPPRPQPHRELKQRLSMYGTISPDQGHDEKMKAIRRSLNLVKPK